jgi:hypothetical protein
MAKVNVIGMLVTLTGECTDRSPTMTLFSAAGGIVRHSQEVLLWFLSIFFNFKFSFKKGISIFFNFKY